MKLLEILKKELKQFPEGMLYAVQDYDGEVKFGKHSQPTLDDSYGIWQRHEDGNCSTISGLELSEDWDSAIVTKDMWESDRVEQIIVNVVDLVNEEKKRIVEALAKVKDVKMCNPRCWDNIAILYGPSFDGEYVGWNYYKPTKSTHTPQQVLEMAGMTKKRNVRKDFDPSKDYSVDVSKCTEEGKKEVQQAFFDAGFQWANVGKTYQHLYAAMYTNMTGDGHPTKHCMYGNLIDSCSMNPDEFLELVYEPVQQGHVHADLMTQYAEDAKTTDKPWELWQFKVADNEWRDLTCNPTFATHLRYRRKPKTHMVHGVEVPDLRFDPKEGEEYYLPYPLSDKLCFKVCFLATSTTLAHHNWRASNNLRYEPTEEGKQAAILHAKAWLGIA